MILIHSKNHWKRMRDNITAHNIEHPETILALAPFYQWSNADLDLAEKRQGYIGNKGKTRCYLAEFKINYQKAI